MRLTARIAATFNRSGAARDNTVGAAATPAVSPAPKGPVRPHTRLLALLAISLVALLATTASASAAPLAAKMETISNVSYTSAHVTGKLTSPCTGFCGTDYSFQYATSESGPWNPGPSGFIDSSGGPFENKLVEGDFENLGLKGGTKYFVRLTASTFFGGGAEATDPEAPPYPSFTTLAVDPPTIPGAVEASPVFSTSAKAIGKVKRPANPADPKPGADDAFDVNCHFDYITDAQFQDNITNSGPDAGFTGATPVPCTQNPIKEADAGIEKNVDAEFAKGTLTPATTYHLRLVAENAAPGVVVKEAPNFTTAPKVGGPTVTDVNDASEVKFNTATLSGKVLRPAGADPALDVNCHFEYVTDAAFQPADEEQSLTVRATGGTFTLYFEGQTTAPIAFDASAATVQAELEGLSTIGAGNLNVSGGPGDETGTAPYAIDFGGSLGAKDVEQISVDPSALEEVGVASAETAIMDEGHAGGFESPQTAECAENPITAAKVDPGGEMKVSAKPGLVATTKYHFRLVAENEGGADTMVAANTFTTPEAEVPSVSIDPLESGAFTAIHVSGRVEYDDPGQDPTINRSGAYIESSTDNENWVRYGSGGEGLSNYTQIGFDIDRDITGLQPSTTYFFRVSATYSGAPYDQAIANGEVGFSPVLSITTEPPQAPPTAEDLAVTDVTATSAHFSGTVNPNAPAGPLSGPAKKAYETKWHFECAPECKDRFGNEIGGVVQGEEGAQPVAADVEGLDPNTPYEVSLVVHSEGGDDTETLPFPTELIKPTVKALPGGSDGEGGYTLAGIVNPNHSAVSKCEFRWGPNSAAYAFKADCSPPPGAGAKPVTVEAHLTSLEPGSVYHFKLFATNAAGEEESNPDLEFTPTLAAKEPCPANEQQRIESNSLALPECRAYEMVTPPGKEGFGAYFSLGESVGSYDGGDRVAYVSEAGNIAKSGQAAGNYSSYVAARTESGWETIPNLNGSSGSLRDAPNFVDSSWPITTLFAYSQDLRSTVWGLHRQGYPGDASASILNLRGPDGTFAPIGSMADGGGLLPTFPSFIRASADLSHVVNATGPTEWGPGVYEYVGTGMDQPRRVDLDNSGAPISTCTGPGSGTVNRSLSSDGATIVNYVYGGCGGANPPGNELWARVNGTTAVDVSASQCDRGAADPGGLCNGPVGDGGCTYNSFGAEVGAGCRVLRFQAATPDGSRVFFTTEQQLVDEDIDQTNDIYACDLPSGNPAPTSDKANHCSAFRQLSTGDPTGAAVESVGATSENGATVLFTAKGKLADNDDALKEKAVAGDHNLYVWRTDASHPDGQTAFVGRLESNDLKPNTGGVPQSTPDGRYLVFTTASRLLETDTDSAPDVYRYDADTGALTRVSTNVFGVAGNGDFDARISGPAEHRPSTAISDDGTKIVFTTTEPLKLAVDNNDESDVYLWTPERVSLISTGAVGAGGGGARVTASGHDIYFGTAGALTPPDGDDLGDIYDARIDGGFSFAPQPVCTGEKCQPPPSGPPAVAAAPANRPKPNDNVVPKTCPKGKVLKKNGKCVKKNKKHSGKKHHHKKNKRTASHGRGGNK